MKRIASVIGGLATVALASAAHAQLFDHLQCHKVKDTLPRERYTADLLPRDVSFPANAVCIVKTPAKLYCTETDKQSIEPTPPGAAPGTPAPRVLCYKVKCDGSAGVAVHAVDQFGTREVLVKAPRLLCAPLPTPTTTTTTTTLPPQPSAGCPLVNEVMTASSTSASEEFVEVLNPCTTAVDLSGVRLVYRSASGSTDILLHAWEDGTVVASGDRLVYGSDAFTGPKDGDLAAGLAGTGGGVAVRDAGGALTDAVGYGTATNAFVEAAPAPAPAAGSSISRVPDAADTDDNAADWMESTPTPGAENAAS